MHWMWTNAKSNGVRQLQLYSCTKAKSLKPIRVNVLTMCIYTLTINKRYIVPITSPNIVTGMYLIVIIGSQGLIHRTNVSKRRVWIRDYTMAKHSFCSHNWKSLWLAHKNATLMLMSIFSVTVHTYQYLHMPLLMNKKEMYASKV